MKTVSGNISWSQVVNGAFLVLWVLVGVANGFGFASYRPPDELVIIVPAIVAIINLLLRYFRTKEPIAR